MCVIFQVDAIQVGTHNTCLYEEVDKKYKTMELLLDFALIGVCAVIRSNTVIRLFVCSFLLTG